MPQAELCAHCRRPKYTEADLKRWFDEVGPDYRGPDPEWARALCWTKPQYACLCRPVDAGEETTDANSH